MNWRTIEAIKQIMISTANSVFSYKIDFKIALWFRSFIYGMAEAVFSVQTIVKFAQKMLYVQTARGEFLKLLGGYFGVDIKTGAKAKGTVNVCSDIAGVVFPFGTLGQAGNGYIFETVETGTTIKNEFTLLSFKIENGTAYCETTAEHNFATGQEIELVLSASTLTASDGIVVTDTTSFQFTTDEDPVASDTGTCYDYFVEVLAQSQLVGVDKNLESGSLQLLDTIADARDDIYVNSKLLGGADIESDDNYRSRILSEIRKLKGVWTIQNVISAGLRVVGNENIIVDLPTLGIEAVSKVAGFQPIAGETVAYVIRRDSSGAIMYPVASSILAETKQNIIAYGKLPANQAEGDIYAFSPQLQTIDLTLEIVPNTASMQTAVRESMASVFYDNEYFDNQMTVEDIENAGRESFDFDTGVKISTFTVNSPTTVPIVSKHIPVLGVISFV